ncbi:MAG: immune inhibitor A, partial [Anaerolineales bacterium]|nr:immune inhibitor A [Anaerolineales bacterium]
MKQRTLGILAIIIMLVGVLPLTTFASGPLDGNDPADAPKVDDRMDPRTVQQRTNLETALEAKLNGKAEGKTHEVAKGQFVELDRQGEDAVWTVMGEFSDFPHNSITEPDRSVDNTTMWAPDFNQDYYMDMLFSDEPGANSMRNFYIEQS